MVTTVVRAVQIAHTEALVVVARALLVPVVIQLQVAMVAQDVRARSRGYLYSMPAVVAAVLVFNLVAVLRLDLEAVK